MNIITRKAYNTIMVEGLESTGKNLVAIVKDVYVFVGSFTYIMDFVVLDDIGEFILRDMAEVLMGKPFRRVTKLEYDYAKGLYLMRRSLEVVRKFHWTILGGRFNQISLVKPSEPLVPRAVSKPKGTNTARHGARREEATIHPGKEQLESRTRDGQKIERELIYDKKKLGSSLEVSLDDSWRTI
ncbi:hypothetical protein Tco_0525757 [Tanacetum coccineum]